MLDIKFIRENPDIVKGAVKNKGVDFEVDKLLAVDERRRHVLQEYELLKAEQNKKSKAKQEQTPENIEELRGLKERVKILGGELVSIQKEFDDLILQVPNIPTDDTPIGTSEKDNVVSKTVGEIPKFNFESKNHWQITESLDLIDKERAAKVAGSRFAYIKGALVRMQFVLIQFTLDQLTDQKVIQKIIKNNDLEISDTPFVPVLPPALIRTEAYKGTARLNSQEVTYKIEGDDLWLNASAEHSLCPMYKDEILEESQLPIRYLGYTTAFRREAGTYGKDMEGIFRMHQFDKLELESFAAKDTSFLEHLFFIAIQEYLMQKLEIPYQVLLKCAADIGFANARGVDIEAWLPGQNKYRETHTADYMTDFQTRRLNTRVRRSSGGLEYVHTNDATAFAMGRALIAIIENYQTEKGTIKVPKVLQPYMGGLKEIK